VAILPVACPELLRRREPADLLQATGARVEFQNPLAVGGVGERYVKQFGVPLDLFKAIGGISAGPFGLDDGDRQAVGVLQNIVGDQWPFLAMAPRGGPDTPSVDRVLAANLIVPPAGLVRQRGQYESSAGLVLDGVLESGRHSIICTGDRRHNPGSSAPNQG
jgi:hypothetical protein